MTGATARSRLNAVELWTAVEMRGIQLTPILNGSIWTASVERVRTPRAVTRAVLEVVSATASTAHEAVEKLLSKLDSGEAGITFEG